MAILENDDLQKYLNENKSSQRQDNWLLFTPLSQPNSPLIHSISGSNDLRQTMFQELKRQGISGPEISAFRQNQLIPDSCFEWFENTERFFKWMSQKKELTSVPYNLNPFKLNYKNHCIALVDSTNKIISEKIFDLEKLKMDWRERLNAGDLIRWADGCDDPDAVKIIYTELVKFRHIFFPTPYSTPRNAEELLMFVDSLIFTVQECRSASKAAKQKISQRKFRAKKNKKQLNLPIDTDVLDMLGALAKANRLSKTKVVELLIREEFKHKKYISAKLTAWLRGEAT